MTDTQLYVAIVLFATVNLVTLVLLLIRRRKSNPEITILPRKDCRKPVRSIDPATGETVTVYDSVSDALVAGGSMIHNVLNGKQETHRGLRWEYVNPIDSKKKKKKRRASHGQKPVRCVNPATGEVVSEYDSVSAATKVAGQAVNHVLSGRQKTCGGLLWEYCRPTDSPSSRRTLPVQSVHPVTGEITAKYASVTAAIQIYGSGVGHALRGKQKTCGGFKWVYQDPSTIPQPIPARQPVSCDPTPIDPALDVNFMAAAMERSDHARITRDIRSVDDGWELVLKDRAIRRPTRAKLIQIWYSLPDEERLPLDLDSERRKNHCGRRVAVSQVLIGTPVKFFPSVAEAARVFQVSYPYLYNRLGKDEPIDGLYFRYAEPKRHHLEKIGCTT